MRASCLSAASCASPMHRNGDGGAGFCNTLIKSSAVLVAACFPSNVGRDVDHVTPIMVAGGDQFIPCLDGEVAVDRTHPGNEMIFECLDCPFCRIAVMVVCQCQLEVHTSFVHEVMLYDLGGFIVQDLEFWCWAPAH
eukprot:15348185-Ditylum_brightwellii.AAC.2